MVVLKRLGHLVVVLFCASVLTFSLTSLLPGDPAVIILGAGSTPDAIAAVHHQLGLDQSLPVRYLQYLGRAVHGDLGRSYVNGEPVGQAVMEHVGVTMELILFTELLSLLVAVPLAVLSAYRKGGRLDRFVGGLSFGVLSVPSFVLAVLLIYLLAVKGHVLPASGYQPLSAGVWQNVRTLLLPAVTLTAGLAPVYLRLLRNDLVTVLQEDFILMARAQGLPPRTILLRQALRPASFSLLTVAGINVAALIGGAVIVEYIFALPGLGSLMINSITSRDYLIIQGITLFVAVLFAVVNLAIDLLYSVLDPRVRRVAT